MIKFVLKLNCLVLFRNCFLHALALTTLAVILAGVYYVYSILEPFIGNIYYYKGLKWLVILVISVILVILVILIILVILVILVISKTLDQTTQYRKTNHWPILLKLWRSSSDFYKNSSNRKPATVCNPYMIGHVANELRHHKFSEDRMKKTNNLNRE